MSLFKRYGLAVMLLSIVLANPLNAEWGYDDDEDDDKALCCDTPFPLPHKLYIGPEIYYLRRTRHGGTKQSGMIYGVRGGYDYIKRFKFYWGFDGLYGTGTICGRSGTHEKLKSRWTDEQVEGRFGYTLQSKCWFRPSFTPFVGYGYFRELNEFHHPSPVHLKFCTRYGYVLGGFLSSIDLCPTLSVGVNFKLRWMNDAKCKVSNDPEFEDVTLNIKNRINYRIEVPVAYRICSCADHFEFDVVPFYEYRHYGGLENFPFDFLETKVKLYGVSFLFSYRF